MGEQSKTSFSINVLCKQFEGNFFFLHVTVFVFKFTSVESDYTCVLQRPWKMGRNCINKQSNAVINYAI